MTKPAQPTWLVPAVPGSVSSWGNGGQLPLGGATALRFTALYSNPGDSTDTAGQIRVTGQRTSTSSLGYGGGGAVGPVWDGGWVGNATVSQYPDFNGLNSFGMAYSSIGNRIYLTGGSNGGEGVLNNVWSAPFNGGSIGTWRPETPLPIYARMHCCVIIGSFIHVISGQQTQYARYASTNVADATGHCWTAPILGDGVVGGWQLQKLDLPAARCYAHAIQAGNYDNPADPNWGLPILVVSGGANTDGSGTAQAATYATTINADGSFQGWVAYSSLLTARYGHYSLYDDNSGKIWVFGGTTGSAALSSIEVATWNTGTRTMGTWANNGNLPAVRAGAAGVYVPAWDNTKKGRVALFGGTQAATLPATTSLSNAIIYGAVPPVSTISWTVSSRTLPEAVNCLGAASVLEATAGGYSNGQWQIAVLGGRIATGGVTGSGSTRTTMSFEAAPPNTATDFAITTATGAALTAAALGYDAALVTRSTGDQEWTFDYNFSTSQLAVTDPLLAGDEVEFAVQFLANQSGDPSPIAYTTVKIGHPIYTASIATYSPSGTISTGQPTASFTFTHLYGAKQATWQLVVKDNVSRIVFDSGIRPDLDNSVLVNTAPLLVSGTPYTFIFAATTDLAPIDSRSTASSTVTTTVTPSYTAPAVPT